MIARDPRLDRPIAAYDLWAFRVLLSNAYLNGNHLAAMSKAWKPLAVKMNSQELSYSQRKLLWEGFLACRGDSVEIEKAMAEIKPFGPSPPPPSTRFATCADIRDLDDGQPWTWEGWLPSSRVVGVAAAEGVGKTRFALDLARRAWHQLPWPDGQAMTLPAQSPTIWVAADGQQNEIALTLPDLDMPASSVIFPTPFDDPFGGTSLDDLETWDFLNGAIGMHKPAFVVVDSLTYATQCDIGEQRSIARLKGPLVQLAQDHRTIVMLLLHVSKEGQALGRRIRGITRTLMHLEAPDSSKPERLRLWVEKSYAAKPPALGVTIGKNGNTYDAEPPSRADPSKGGRPPVGFEKASKFLQERLAIADRKAIDLVNEWVDSGEPKTTLFNAKKRMVDEGTLIVDDSQKPQTWRLNVASFAEVY